MILNKVTSKIFTTLKMKSIITFCIGLITNFLVAQVEPLKNAHSHNDYCQNNPLTDALNNRFNSIEVDVFLIKNQLFVSHTYPVFKKQTLEELYLNPLQKIWRERNQEIYRDEPLILLIDIKSNAEKTYLALQELLKKHNEMFTQWSNGQIYKRAVTVVISGNTPKELVKNNSNQMIFLDQNLLSVKELRGQERGFMASTKYSNVLKWKGKGEIPKAEKEKLITLVNQAHQQGKKVRLWASPENTIVWKALLDCGVDLINTDELKKLNSFLMKFKT